MNGLTPGDNGGFHPLNVNSRGDLFIGGGNNGGGLSRSLDGGSNWTHLDSLNPGSSIICISFDNNDNIFVGTGTGIFRSMDNGDTWSQYGMIGSQTEAIAFNDSGHVFAGNSYAVYRSTDDGATWTPLPTGGGTRTVAVAPNGYIFAGCQENAGIIRSTDNGDSWAYAYPQTVSISFASTVHFDSNGDIYFPTWGMGVLRSTDNGDTWDQMNNNLGRGYVKVIARTGTGDCFAGGDYALYKSTDNCASWFSVGISICSVRHISINSGDDIFAGVWGVNRSTDGGQTWQTINNGLGNYDVRAVTIKENGSMFVGGADNPNGLIFRSTDNGESWARADSFPSGISVTGLTAGPGGEIIVAGSGYGLIFHKSTDEGVTWQDITYGTAVGAGKLAFNSAGDLFSASYGGGLWKLPAGDTTWIDLTSNYGYNWISSIFIARDDYIYADSKRSTDDGLTWSAMSINTGVAGFAENSAGHLFCATTNFGIGVLRSTDHGETWEEVNDGLPIMDIRSVAVDSEDYLYAGSNGKSMFKTTTSTVTSVGIEPAPRSFLLGQNYPNPFNPVTVISYQLPTRSAVRLTIYDVLGRDVTTLVNETKPPGTYAVPWDASGKPSGVYIYRLEAGNFVGAKKLLLLK